MWTVISFHWDSFFVELVIGIASNRREFFTHRLVSYVGFPFMWKIPKPCWETRDKYGHYRLHLWGEKSAILVFDLDLSITELLHFHTHEQKRKEFLVLILEDFRGQHQPSVVPLWFKCLISGNTRKIILPACSENCHLLQDLESVS